LGHRQGGSDHLRPTRRASTQAPHQAQSKQITAESPRRGPSPSRINPPPIRANLSGSPRRLPPPQTPQSFDPNAAHPHGRTFGPTRLIVQTPTPAFDKSVPPLVTRRATDAEKSAQFHKAFLGLKCLFHKTQALTNDRDCFPRHSHGKRSNSKQMHELSSQNCQRCLGTQLSTMSWHHAVRGIRLILMAIPN
jgi:hypothetical protein